MAAEQVVRREQAGRGQCRGQVASVQRVGARRDEGVLDLRRGLRIVVVHRGQQRQPLPGDLMGFPEPPGSEHGEADRVERGADQHRIARGACGRGCGLRQRHVRCGRLRTRGPRRRNGQRGGHCRIVWISGCGRLVEQTAQLLVPALGGKSDHLVAAGGLHRPGQRDRLGIAVAGGAGPLRRGEQQLEGIRPRGRADERAVGGIAQVVDRLGSGGGELGRCPVVVHRLQQEPPREGQVTEGPGELVWHRTGSVRCGRKRRPHVTGHGVELAPPPAAQRRCRSWISSRSALVSS